MSNYFPDEVRSEIRTFKNGKVKISYHNGMIPLKVRQPNGMDTTVEEYIQQIEKYLMDDERVEIGDTAVNVYKTYGVEL